MNYIGSKHSLLPFLERVYRKISDGTETTFCDLFAGTGAVGRHFKKLGLRVIANDAQYYAYVLNRGSLELNHPPHFSKLRKSLGIPMPPDAGPDTSRGAAGVFRFLEGLPRRHGFLTRTYAPRGGRLYFTDENASKADVIRARLDRWHADGLLSANEYFYLLAALIEGLDDVANTACIYEAFLKRVKARAARPLRLATPRITNGVTGCQVFNRDANDLVGDIECDVLYLDPPYNGRQYASNYHVLETLARNDRPAVRGKTGMRDGLVRSAYSRKREVTAAFEDLIRRANAKHILLSYNDEGLMPLDEIKRILALRGRPKTFKTTYSRFKADNGREYKRNATVEFVHYVRVTKG